MKYRKKPLIIEAIKWDGNRDEMNTFIGLADNPDDSKHSFFGHDLLIKTLEGTMTASKGDWVIRGVKGEVYPCKPDIFELTYEMV